MKKDYKRSEKRESKRMEEHSMKKSKKGEAYGGDGENKMCLYPMKEKKPMMSGKM